MNWKLFFRLITGLFIVPIHLVAQPPVLKFKHISVEQGLSNSTIETIFQDHRGFIWIGTRDGLNRYDGNQMQVYRFNEKDSNSISDNYIRYIYEDRAQNLWIGTINGLNRFDPAANHFSRYKHDPDNPKSINHNFITNIYEDKRGNLWIGTWGGGPARFQPKDNSFISVYSGAVPKKVSCLYEDTQSNLWVAGDSGLYQLNRETGSFKSFRQLAPFTLLKGYNDIRVINEDRMGNLLLGTEDNGLLLFNYKDLSFEIFRHDDKNPGSLASNQVRAILVDKSWNTWIGGVNGGLDLFEPSKGIFHHYQNEPDNVFSLSQRTVSALFEDNQRNLWVGTHRGGINLYSPNTEKFSLYRQEPSLNSLSYSDVKTFYEKRNGEIWIGTDGGGLNLFNKKNKTFRHYKADPFIPGSISSNEILDVLEDNEGNTWISSWGGGLNLLHPNSSTFTRFNNNPADPQSISSNYIQQVFEDSKQNLWIATYYGGLNILDRKTKKFNRIITGTDQKSKLQGNNIIVLNEDKTGKIWIGTDDGGLNCYNPSTGQFFHYFNNAEKMPDIRVIFVDSKGRLWIGQTGLYLFDPVGNKFNLYTTKAGLSTEFIKGITEDEQGNFWISTSNGLTRFNPGDQSFKKYNTADGLQGLEFEANAYLKTKDGEMYFGGVNGFNSFYPENIRNNPFIPPVYITSFQLFNQEVQPAQEQSPLEKDISLTKEIHLTYQQSTFSFGFAALNYTALENNQYAYKLEGWDQDWQYVSGNRRASYTNLPPASYTFRVKASNNDGAWNEEGSTLRIIITPPFWATWWFRFLIIAASATALILFFRMKRKQELKKLEEEKKEEIHQVQLQFFTNISHEFRTPLSLILGPLEKLQKEDGASPFTHHYQLMHRNANRLMNLINELMDFRKAESGALKLHVMPGNLDIFLREIAEEFSELALQKKMRFSIVIPAGLADVWFDRQVLEKIVINLISNSFKYTHEGGTVDVNVFESMESFKPSFENELVLRNDYQGKKYVYVRVADNGIGISKESIGHLFERYYKITDTHLGSGIGLAFVKSLTMLHKGNIYVYSERNKGTEIILGIPVSMDDYERQERWIKSNVEEAGPRLESIHHRYEHHTTLADDPAMLKPAANSANVPHILIVDDNDELRRFLNESLRDNYHITEAPDGLTGISKARDEFPDLIISDVMMPYMDGNEFCKRIKEDIETSHIPFLMLTAKNAVESQIEGTASGADYYFAKPVSIELLRLTVRNILHQKQKLKEKYFTDQYADATELVHSVKDKEFLEELIRVIESHLTNPEMDVEYICSQVGMSKTKLYQKIKKITGQSIGEFIRTIRFRKAVQLMTNQDMPLTEVMYSVGIQTQSYFTKAFKQEFGKTPTQFLKDLRSAHKREDGE